MISPALGFAAMVEEIMRVTRVDRARAEAVAHQNGFAPPAPDPAGTKSSRGRGMNKTEARRAAELEAMKRAGIIRDWQYEAITLKLADACRYTPDFLVEEISGAIRVEETKGYWRDDARVKIKLAARLFPMFRFVALTVRPANDGGGWHTEEFSH